MNSSDLAYQRQNFIMDFIDSSCDGFVFNPENYKTIEDVISSIEACDQGIEDWEAIMSYDDDEDTIRLNRAGLQRVKTEKKYLKKLLKEFQKSALNSKEVVYS